MYSKLFGDKFLGDLPLRFPSLVTGGRGCSGTVVICCRKALTGDGIQKGA